MPLVFGLPILGALSIALAERQIEQETYMWAIVVTIGFTAWLCLFLIAKYGFAKVVLYEDHLEWTTEFNQTVKCKYSELSIETHSYRGEEWCNLQCANGKQRAFSQKLVGYHEFKTTLAQKMIEEVG